MVDCQDAPTRFNGMVRQLATMLRRVREYQGLSQAQLALVLGCSRGTINNLEAGRKQPSLGYLVTFANQMHLSLDTLLRGDVSLSPQRWVVQTVQRDSRYFGENLRMLRHQADITQAAFAHALGLRTQAHISLLERGQKYPSLELLVLIAETVQTPIDALFLAPAALLPVSEDTSHQS